MLCAILGEDIGGTTLKDVGDHLANTTWHALHIVKVKTAYDRSERYMELVELVECLVGRKL